MSNRCGECLYFSGRRDCKCRRYPPVPIKREGYVEMMWPSVSWSDWCGEFKEGRRLSD